MRNQKLKQLIINAQFAIIIAILAQFTLPLGPIPLTGQTLAVGIVATILGGINGTITVAIYLLMGLIGLPVFAGGAAGIGALVGPTGGFLIGFLFNALLTGTLLEKTSFNYFWSLIANNLGALVTLLFGTFWLKISLQMAWGTAFSSGFIPFIIPGVIKAVAAAYLGIILRNALIRAKVLKPNQP